MIETKNPGGIADTMRTLGNTPFPGQIPKGAPFTAHPHVDPNSGDLVGYGYGLNGVESNDVRLPVALAEPLHTL